MRGQGNRFRNQHVQKLCFDQSAMFPLVEKMVLKQEDECHAKHRNKYVLWSMETLKKLISGLDT